MAVKVALDTFGTYSICSRHILDTPDTFRKLQTHSGSSRHIQFAPDTFRMLQTNSGPDWSVPSSKVFVNLRNSEIWFIFPHFFTFVKIC